MVSKHLGARKEYERTVEIKVNEAELKLIINFMYVHDLEHHSHLVKNLKLREKLSELRRYKYPKEKS